MSDLESSVREAANRYLRTGEHVQGVGAVSRAVPALAASVSLLRSIYLEHFLVVATNERLLFFPTNVGLLGGVSAPTKAPFALPYTDLARLEPCRTLVIGASAMRFTLRAGLQHEFTYRATVPNLASHAAFGAGFPGWLAPLIESGAFAARGAADPASTPALAALPGRPMVGAWLLLLAGGFALFAGLMMSLMAVASGLTEGLLAMLPVLLLGAAAMAGGMHLRRQRAAQLGETVVPLAELFRQNKKVYVRRALMVGLPLSFLCIVGMIVSFVQARNRAQSDADFADLRAAGEARVAAAQAQVAAQPALSATAPAAAQDLPSEIPITGTLLTEASARTRLEGFGFRVTAAPAPTTPGRAWSLVATGSAGQVLTYTALTTAPSQDQAGAVFTRSRRADGVVLVSGPDAALRSRIAQRVGADAQACLGFGNERCWAELGGTAGTVLAAGMPLQIGAARYQVTWDVKPTSTSCATNETGMLCVAVDLSGASMDSYARMQNQNPWTRWALSALSHP
ncbi:MAG: hypothetical protein IPG81_07515 [Sandaracinaceae bacterium]|nr:hypothetical protein [Sandaracinaceae bacterium]MBK8593568.1 hypothetical protein [Sandaracinaceae bacterium]